MKIVLLSMFTCVWRNSSSTRLFKEHYPTSFSPYLKSVLRRSVFRWVRSHIFCLQVTYSEYESIRALWLEVEPLETEINQVFRRTANHQFFHRGEYLCHSRPFQHFVCKFDQSIGLGALGRTDCWKVWGQFWRRIISWNCKSDFQNGPR